MTRCATLDLPLLGWDGTYLATVPATIIHDIAPHLAHFATFAVHRWRNNLWRVSHVETGARIGLSWRRRQDAIDNARALLALHTPRTIAAHVRRAVKHASEIAKRELFGIAR